MYLFIHNEERVKCIKNLNDYYYIVAESCKEMALVVGSSLIVNFASLT